MQSLTLAGILPQIHRASGQAAPSGLPAASSPAGASVPFALLLDQAQGGAPLRRSSSAGSTRAPSSSARATAAGGRAPFTLPGLQFHAVARPSIQKSLESVRRSEAVRRGTATYLAPRGSTVRGRTTPKGNASSQKTSTPGSGVPRVRSDSPAQLELARSIRRTSALAGVSPELSVAVARAESNLDAHARSSDGLSFGTFQMTRATRSEMQRRIANGTVDRPAGSEDVALAVGYLRYLNDLFAHEGKLGRSLHSVPVQNAGERQMFAVAAYNAGEGRVARAQAQTRAAGGNPTRFAEIRRFLPGTTRDYVDRVMGFAQSNELPISA